MGIARHKESAMTPRVGDLCETRMYIYRRSKTGVDVSFVATAHGRVIAIEPDNFHVWLEEANGIRSRHPASELYTCSD